MHNSVDRNEPLCHGERENELDAPDLAIDVTSAPSKLALAGRRVPRRSDHRFPDDFELRAGELRGGQIPVQPSHQPDDLAVSVQLLVGLRAAGVGPMALRGDVVRLRVAPERFQDNRYARARRRIALSSVRRRGQGATVGVPLADEAVIGGAALSRSVRAEIDHSAVDRDVGFAGRLVQAIRRGGLGAGHGTAPKGFFCTVQKNSTLFGRSSQHGKVCLSKHPA
jgi:hypothetical protein